jgi:hypothetical protein
MTKRNCETKAEWLAKEVARALSAGKAWASDTADLSDPSRPPTCLEVAVPFIEISYEKQ